ncbi:MAG: protein BatD [Bacteroidetes bacterium]|nr:protein BatD [Bacteroidota bacterium]
MKKYLLSAILMMFLIIPGVLADEIKFTASARNLVSLGDRFQLTYTVNERGGKFSGPSIKHFRVLSGPNISRSQSYQVINGRMSQSITVSYVYYLQAFEEGKFEIPAATISIDGKISKSNTLSIEVIKGNIPKGSVQQTGQNTAGTATSVSTDQNTKDDVFLKAFITNKNPFQGEQLLITYKIYTNNVPISDINIENLASFPGFWSTNLQDNNKQITPEKEIIGGTEYLTGKLYQGALFAQKSGKLGIDAKKLSCTAQVRKQGTRKTRDPFFDSFFDDPFFNNQYQNVRIEMESNPLSIQVKPLPIDKKPPDFSGAVGNFKFSGSVDNTELKVNDAITLKLVISGSGNLELINTPDINFPPDFEAYEPKITKNIRTSASGVSGSRTFEYLAIPRSAGDFSVGPIELSYFDPKTEKYKVLRTEIFNFHIEKGDQSSTSVTYSGVAQEDIMYLGQDIHYIKTGTFQLTEKGYFLIASPFFFILLAAPVVLLIFLSFLLINMRKRRSDLALMRNKKATKVARKNLKKAREFLKTQQQEAFYTEISRALWGYLSDKFNIPLSDLSMDSVSERLTEKQLSPERISKFIEVLNSCEYARFAPGESSGLMNEIYNESINVISQIEGELKS